jgi:hypothetical protein
MIYFGVTLQYVTIHKEHEACLKLISTRELISFNAAAKQLSKQYGSVSISPVELLLGGDLSFSYVPDNVTLNSIDNPYANLNNAVKFLSSNKDRLIFSHIKFSRFVDNFYFLVILAC